MVILFTAEVGILFALFLNQPIEAKMKQTLPTVAALLMLTACGGVSSPVPQPVPGQIRISSPALTSAKVLVVGLTKAVSGVGTVHLRDLKTGATASAKSAASGTFSLVITAGPDRQLEAWFETADGNSDPVSLSLRSLSYGPALGQPGTGLVSTPDAQGKVTVANDGGAGKPLLLTATPNMVLVLSNSSTAEVTTTTTDKDGRFSKKLSGAKGDQIQLLLVDPGDQASTSDFVTVAVP